MFCGYIRNISSILTYISFNKKKKALTYLQLFCNYNEITLHANCSDRCLIASLNRGVRIYPWVFSIILLDHLLPLLKAMKIWSSSNKFLFCCCVFGFSQHKSMCSFLHACLRASPSSVPLTRGSLSASGSTPEPLKASPPSFLKYLWSNFSSSLSKRGLRRGPCRA